MKKFTGIAQRLTFGVIVFGILLSAVCGALGYNAGHETPFIRGKDGIFKPHKIASGFVLAGMDGIKYKCGSFVLEAGDMLFQYTDGVTEASNVNNELYGEKRLEAALNRHASMPPRELLPKLKEDIDAFAGNAPQFDDITMICLEVSVK